MLLDLSNPKDAHVEKYDALIKAMDSDPEKMAADYSEVIRVTLIKFISWS